MPITRAQSKAIDQYAEQELGLPAIVLMENAAIGAADIAKGMLAARSEQGQPATKVAIVCGGGNNGGDGYALARHLYAAGLSVGVFAAVNPEDLKGEAQINAIATSRCGVAVVRCDTPEALAECLPVWAGADLIVDALLGVGFAGGEVRKPIANAIRAIEAAKAGATCLDVPAGGCGKAGGCGCASTQTLSPTAARKGPWVLALDVPSGLDADSGVAENPTVKADATVTFVDAKVGMNEPYAVSYVGQLFVVGIGLPVGVVGKAVKG